MPNHPTQASRTVTAIATAIALAATPHHAAAQSNVSVKVVDLTPKFVAFYEQALKENADSERRWALWEQLDNFAAVPPIAAGKQMARKLLDSAWARYPAAMDRIRAGAGALQPAPQPILEQVATLLGSGDAAVQIALIVFVGGFESNAFTGGRTNGVTMIAVPVEDSDEQHRIAMTHEFTHAVQAALGSWSGTRTVAGTVFAEGVAMRATQALVPGLPETRYSHSDPAWLAKCRGNQAAILDSLRAHYAERGPEATSRFTVGMGTTGMQREAYCAGWLVLGYGLAHGDSFASLAHLSEDDAQAWVERTTTALLAASRRPPDAE